MTRRSQPPPAQPQRSPRSPAQRGPPSTRSPNSAEPGMADGTDDGIVQVAPDAPRAPVLNERADHRAIPTATSCIRRRCRPAHWAKAPSFACVCLTASPPPMNQSGDPFRTRVASDVIQDGQVLIPAGAEIDGKVDIGFQRPLRRPRFHAPAA